MSKKSTALLCICTSLLGATSALAIPKHVLLSTNREATPTLLAQAPSPAPTVLTAEDLPTGFVEIPPTVREQIIGQFEVLTEEFGQDTLKIDDLFGFFNPEKFQAVIGFTGGLPTASDRENFDANLQKLQDPKIQQQILNQIQEKLKGVGDIEVKNYQSLPELNTLADASTGISLELTMEGEAFQIEIVTFRRQGTGAFTAVIYPQSGDAVALKGLAEKLDRRIVESASATQLPR